MSKVILILAANPKNTPTLRLDEELREIENGLERSPKREEFELHQKLAVRPDDVRRAMLKYKPNIVHFCGHGSGEDGIAFEDRNGKAQLVNAETLAAFFKLFKNTVECVLLNACYSEVQAEAISKNIPYVIGMKKAIGDLSAIEFAVAFYDALGSGNPVEFAYELACNAIQWTGIPEHLTPVLKINSFHRDEELNSLLSHSASVSTFESTRTNTDVSNYRDWGDAPDLPVFFGRAKEIETLEQWILKDKCRIVSIIGLRGIGKTRLSIKLGKGGIGKTDLSIKLAQGLENKFEYVIWRKLLNAPKVSDILSDCIKFLSNQKEVDLPDDLHGKISRLLYYLQANKCLLIFDNVESILRSGEFSGHYLEGYEGYGELFKQIGETPNQSCLLLTSREKPKEIALLEGKNKPVRSLELNGLKEIDAKKIFKQIGYFEGTSKDWKDLTTFYNGNPLALELAAKHINEVFFGNISEFLKEGKPLFQDLRDLLTWHFDRLSELEKEVLYWFAINREPITLYDLRNDLVSTFSKKELTSTLQSLQRRLPLEKAAVKFTLQPVLIEYVTDRLIVQVGDEICCMPEMTNLLTERLVKGIGEEIKTGQINLLDKHALMKAVTKEYLRDTQRRLILNPILDELITSLGSQDELESKLIKICTILQEKYPPRPGYAAGNILNLLCQFKTALTDLNFSQMVIWQAYLQDINLYRVNFSHSNFSKTLFMEAFDSIYAVAFSPNGNLFAAGASNGEIILWDVLEGKQLLKMEGHSNWVRSACFSPDSSILASGSGDWTIRLWEVKTGKCLKVLDEHKGRIYSVAFSPNGQTLVSGSGDKTVRLWDVKTGVCLRTFAGHSDIVWDTIFNPNGQMIVSCGDDKTIRLWDISSGECLKIMQAHTNSVWSVAFHPNGTVLASASNDKTIRLWDITTGMTFRVLEGHTDWARSVAFSLDGNILASGSSDRTIRLWNIVTGDCIKTLQGHSKWVRSVAFSPDGNTLVSGSDDQTVRLWDTKTGLCIKTLRGHTHWIWAVAYNSEDNLIVSGSNDHAIRIWDVNTGECVQQLFGHTHWVWSVAFSPTENIIASGSNDQTIRLWDSKTGQCLSVLRGHDFWVWCVVFSKSGQYLASCSDDLVVNLWDVVTGNCVKTFHGHTQGVRSVVFAQNDRFLVSGGDDMMIRIWNIETGDCVKVLPGHTKGIRSIAFSSANNLIASSGDDQTVRIWDLENEKCLFILEGHSNTIRSIAFSPDGCYLVSGSDDQTIRIWDSQTGTLVNVLTQHKNQVRSVTFNSDGQSILSGSNDGTMKIWYAVNGACLKTLRVPRPCEGTEITGVIGLTDAQKATLCILGAVEN